MAGGHAYTNRLAKEESPYLLQHAHNPVDWFPWGQEAFDLAKALDFPIFLSVGYSTCHWCHVMERESFESEEVARIINDRFVSIKVDREERPDVDRVYMTYVQAISGGGGWPMSVFLTPTLEPIVGGTYFPPEDKYGRPGFKTVLQKVSEAWRKDKEALISQGTRVLSSIAEAITSQETEAQSSFGVDSARKAIETAFKQLSGRFDKENGGFSSAPKFPRVSEINLVLLQHLISASKQDNNNAEKALHMATLTLKKMAAGGIYDHIGGGFARYSVDEKWHVPHFEKMLYDNPQIAQTYLSAFQATGNRGFARVARGVLDYLLRDMRHPEGGFYSAEDADSLDKVSGEKKEGEFYVWKKAEIDEVLGGADTKLCKRFASFYNIQADGNTTLSQMSDPHGEFVGKNVPIIFGEANQGEEEALSEARKKLHERRAQRARPHLDDKVVCGWNGMAIGTLAAASSALAKEDPVIGNSFPVDGRNPEQYLDAAVKAAEFVERKLWSPETKRLKRSFCRGSSDVEGFDSDYAFLTAGLLDLFSANGDTKWLAWAYELQQSMDNLFWDDKLGAYFSTTGQDSSIKLRMKEDQDGAEPAASSVAVSNLLRLAAYSTPDAASKLQDKASRTLAAFSERLDGMPIALTQMCCSAYLLEAGPLRQVIVAGSSQEVQPLLNAVHSVFCPDKVVIPVDPTNDYEMAFWEGHNPEVSSMARSMKDGNATAFICQNFACQAPTSEPEKISQLLSSQKSSLNSKATINVKDLGISDLK